MDLDEEEYKATKEFYEKKRKREEKKTLEEITEENYKHIPYIE